jgi:hypothetical protein
MKNWKDEIDQAVEKMVAQMVQANFSQEKLDMNKNLLSTVADGLKQDLDKYTASDLMFWGCKDAKTYVTGIYGMAGKFADQGSMKHKIASSIAQLM